MVGPKAKRQAVGHLIQKKSASERMACFVIAFSRSTYRRQPQRASMDQRLRTELNRLSRAHPRYGFRRIWGLLRADGWQVNHKKIQRLWREEGLKVTVKAKKKKRLGTSTLFQKRSEYPLHVWSWDFVHDVCQDGRGIKILGVVDEFTRQCVVLSAGRSFRAQDVIGEMSKAMIRYGKPELIRSDNGSEFIAHAIANYLTEQEVGTSYIEPGSPWQNPYIESFNSRLRDECLNRELFSGLLEAQVILADWREDYNASRPHSSLGYKSPNLFARNWKITHAAELAEVVG